LAPYVPSLEGWVGERLLRRELAEAQAPRTAGIPDGVWTKSDGERVLVEVELSPKDPAALRAKLLRTPDSLRRWGCAHVLYVVPNEVVRDAVVRARTGLATEFGAQHPAVEAVAPPFVVSALGRTPGWWSRRPGNVGPRAPREGGGS
jgi:hypothetical protein